MDNQLAVLAELLADRQFLDDRLHIGILIDRASARLEAITLYQEYPKEVYRVYRQLTAGRGPKSSTAALRRGLRKDIAVFEEITETAAALIDTSDALTAAEITQVQNLLASNREQLTVFKKQWPSIFTN
ncbi:MAG: hypothetical protein R3F41_00970 [Gammaproteobacteria bacterium]|nr:hypothetical protein [Pseudomonadales bacterium]